jgi:Tfp pilus assembly protein PilF
MGLLRMQRGEWAEAGKDLESLLVKVPDSDKVNYYLAAVYEQQGKMDATLERLGKVSIDSKLFEDSTLHAAGIHRRAGNTEKALGILKDAIKRSPENPGFYLVMASVFEDEKKNKDASQVLAEGLKVFPEHEKMRYFLGALLEKIGQTDEAVVQMEKILEKNPNHADALNFVAYTWTTQGVRLKDAEDMLKRAMKAKPGNAFILDSFGWNQFMLGKHRNALIYLEKAVGIKGDEETILQHLVEVYSKNQMPDRAQATRARIETLQAQSASRSPAAVDEK